MAEEREQRDVPQYSRRDFLGKTLGGAAALGVGGLLAACGSSSSSSTTTSTTPASTSKPKQGGTFRFVSTGGGSSDTLDGNNCVENLDFARAPQLYDCLLYFDADNTVQPQLATEVTPNSAATEWTIRVRQGVEFHNGKTLTIDDVIYTFNRILTNKYSGSAGLAFVDMKNVKKLDTYTATFPMVSADSQLPTALIGDGEMSIVPEGYNPKDPVGTGAFKYKSFTPGVTSTFVRNPNYWQSPEPYFDEVIMTDYSDETSQVNALLANDADAADQLSIASVQPLKSGGKTVIIWDGPGWVPFTMRLDQAPFSDVNVRQAMRLIVDRPQMRELVFGGYGLIGNDIFGINGPNYDSSIPQRSQDIAQAKSLLKAAGHENLTTTLVTAPIKTGAVQMATVFKQQASAAGVTVNLDSITSGAFFGPNYLKWTFAQDWWSGYPYLRQVGYSMVPGAPWDETHWANSEYGAKYLSLYKQALQTVNASTQADIAHEMQMMDFNYGGYIIPVFVPIIVGQSDKVQGAVAQKTGNPWVQYYFRTLWFS